MRESNSIAAQRPPASGESPDATCSHASPVRWAEPWSSKKRAERRRNSGRHLARGHQLLRERDLESIQADGQYASRGQCARLASSRGGSRHSVLLNYPLQKLVANRGFHLLVRFVPRRRFRDLTNNLKLMRREVVQKLQLLEPGFAVNAETGLQPLPMGYSILEVPLSWINRTPDMGMSSLRLARVGGGYRRALYRLWLKRTFGVGAYRLLPVGKGAGRAER